MRHTELWARLEEALGIAYAETWAKDQVIAGVPPKQVWLEVWRALDLPQSAR
jgi:hypothetical protein